MYLHITVAPQEYDRSEFSDEAVINTDGPAAEIWEPIVSVHYIGGHTEITFGDGDSIVDPSWFKWSVVKEAGM